MTFRRAEAVLVCLYAELLAEIPFDVLDRYPEIAVNVRVPNRPMHVVDFEADAGGHLGDMIFEDWSRHSSLAM